jgi:putative (di)nucleoside polyphosphate hydrolase
MTPQDAARLPYRPCVGVVLINPAGLVFAGQRLDSDSPAWQMPQGGIDAGERPRDAALRELHEETGVTPDLVTFVARTPGWLTYDLPPELLGRVWGGRYRGQRQRWFLFRWRWIAADAMREAIVPFKRDVYDRVIAAFRPHLA